MTDALARRIALALMNHDSFDLVASTTFVAAEGEPVQEDFGFTPIEIARASSDRIAISARYSELKGSVSFAWAAVQARTEWLASLAP